MRCFFCENLEDNFAILNKADERHLFKVLRSEVGKEILLINGNGTLAEGVIASEKRIEIKNRQRYEIPARKIHIFTALPRKYRMDTLLAQCTEAGMWALHPIVSERSVVIPKKDNMIEKWNEKTIEACKQAHNPFVPKIHKTAKLTEALVYIKENKISAYYGSTKSVGCSSTLNDDNLSDVAWFVGPEGGFTEEEVELLEEGGVKGLSLGSWVMRIETAALAGIILLQR
jgi:16S rRNA (uracil1498-N3)-methyltransferase